MLGLGANHAERCWLRHYGFCRSRGLGALGFDGLGCGSEVALHFSFFFLLQALAEDVFVLRVSLREVVVPEALAEFQLAAAFGVALDEQLDAPLDFGGRTLPAAPEILVILDFELANVLFELRHFFVNRGHAWKPPVL